MCMADRKRKKEKYYRPHFVLHFFAILLGYIILTLPLSASCFASGSVFHFSKGISSFERDGSACQEMELLDRGVPVACGAVQIEEAWCQYRFRQRKAEPQETRGRQGTFEAAAVKIEPFARDERWVIRVSSPITAVCNVLMRLRSGGRQYVVQRQFTLYGRGWQSDAWKEALTKRAAFYGHFTLPYLSFENLRNFYRGGKRSRDGIKIGQKRKREERVLFFRWRYFRKAGSRKDVLLPRTGKALLPAAAVRTSGSFGLAERKKHGFYRSGPLWAESRFAFYPGRF